MNVLVVGRTLPTDKTGSFGLFEFNQAKSISQFKETGYLFVVTNSLLKSQTIKKINNHTDGLPTVGYYLPIKGLFYKIHEDIRTKFFIKAYNTFTKKYWTPTVVHIHFPLLVLNPSIIYFLKSKNVKIVVTEHWGDVQEKKISNKHIKLLSFLYSEVDAFLTVSNELKKSVEDLLNIKESEIKVVPNIVDDIFFQKKDSEDKQCDNFIFTYIGSLSKSKRVKMLVSSFQNTFKDTENVLLNIIGEGPERSKIEKIIINNFKDRIYFHGNISKQKVNKYLSNTNVYVSASRYETFGVPFVEALASGVPIIAADNLPVTIYINELNGKTFQVDNEKDLSDKLLYMYRNIHLYEPSIIKSKIYNQFSGYSIGKKLIDIYMSV